MVWDLVKINQGNKKSLMTNFEVTKLLPFGKIFNV